MALDGIISDVAVSAPAAGLTISVTPHHGQQTIGRAAPIERVLGLAEETHALGLLHELAVMRANWDGYGALAIDPTTRRNAEVALQRLVRIAPAPEISANPNGTVSFEWSTRHGEAHLEIGKTKFSFFIKAPTIEAVRTEGMAAQISARFGDIIAAIVFPPDSAVEPVTRPRLTAGHVQANY